MGLLSWLRLLATPCMSDVHNVLFSEALISSYRLMAMVVFVYVFVFFRVNPAHILSSVPVDLFFSQHYSFAKKLRLLVMCLTEIRPLQFCRFCL